MRNFWLDQTKPILALAPIAGITDSAFRLLCRQNGADVVYTEMTSIDALYYDSKKTLAMLGFSKKERPVVLQLFGKRPELVARAVKQVEEAGFSGVDINFGCPARKVVAHEGGITLLKNLSLCQELVSAVCESTTLPVSVKTRVSIGQGKQKVTVLDFLDKIKDLPVSALMLHGRTYEQAFSGPVDYEMMKEARKQFQGIFLANGGLNTPEDVKIMLDKTGADGVGLGRGIFGKPWLFQQIKDYLQFSSFAPLTLKAIKKIALQHAKLNFKTKSEHGLIELRKHLAWYFKGFPGAAEWRQQLVRVETLSDIEKILKRI